MWVYKLNTKKTTCSKQALSHYSEKSGNIIAVSLRGLPVLPKLFTFKHSEEALKDFNHIALILLLLILSCKCRDFNWKSLALYACSF